MTANLVPQVPSSNRDQQSLALYVSVPFCRSRCSFCDYVSGIPTADLLLTAQDSPRRSYGEALCEEIRIRGRELAGDGKVPVSLYWGGGTASSLEAPEIEAVSAAVQESFELSGVIEATIECSPDTVDPPKLSLFRSLGFNRFSCGVQSFDDQRLRHLGRLHTADDARRVIRQARAAGFDNVNIDIMCGFPDETLEESRRTLSDALRLGVDHLSLYPFRPTPGTPLRRVIDRDAKDLYLSNQKLAFAQGRKMITEAGYTEYASGYFGRPSVFAVAYFQMRAAMIGFGSGAMSMFNRRFRSHMKGRLHEYIAQPARYDVDLPANADPVVLSNLRAGLSCFDGVLRAEWQDATGEALDQALNRPIVAPVIRYFRSRGLVEDARGLRFPPGEVGNVLLDLNFRLLGPNGSGSMERPPRNDGPGPAVVA